MKRLLFIVHTMLTCIMLNAQHSITGKAADSATMQPVPFTTVSVLNNKNSVIKSMVSDSLGNFSLAGIKAGHYNIVLTAVGYKRLLINKNINEDLNLNLCLLSPDAGMLSEIVVRGNRPVIAPSVDGFDYNPENDIVVPGSNASDMLRKIPMVTVDQNGNPSLRGSSNIRVFIDDKPSDIYAPTVADALKQIPAEHIVKIEVILYPSAKYDAEGTDGVINIITRRSRFNATNGTLRLRLGNRNQEFSPDMNIRRGNWIFNLNSGASLGNNMSWADLMRHDIFDTRLTQNSESDSRSRAVYAGLNIIYIINDLHTLSGSYRFRTNRSMTERFSLNNYFEQDSLTDSFTRLTNTRDGNDLNSISLTYNGKSRNRKKQYNIYLFGFIQSGINNYDLDQLRKQTVDYSERMGGRQTNNEITVQADYSQTLNDNITWDAGAKSAFRVFGLVNDLEAYDFSQSKFVKDEFRSNHFDFDRGIHAAYGNLIMRYAKWQVRVGLRYEHTALKTIFKDTSLTIPNYKNFIPSIVIGRNFNQQHSLKFSFGRRIFRPGLNTLNPGYNYIDSFNIQAGNPYQVPEETNRYELTYNYNSRQFFFMSSLYYFAMHNGIEQIRTPLGAAVFMTTYQNIGSTDFFGLYNSITWKWNQKFTATFNISLRKIWLVSEALQQSRQGFVYGGNFNMSYIIGKGYSVEAMGNINSDDVSLQGKREQWKYYALVFNKKFKDDKFAVTWRMENILPPSRQSLRQNLSSQYFTQTQYSSYQNHYFYISLSWKLGKKEVKAPVIREGGE